MSDSKELQEHIVRISLRAFFVYGLVGGAIANITSFVVTMFLGLPYSPEVIFQLFITPVPGSIESVLVETLGELAKYGTFTFAAAIYTLLYGVISVFIGYLFRTRRVTSSLHLVTLATMIPTAMSVGIQGLLANRAIILNSMSGWLTATAVMLGVNLIYAMIVIDQLNTYLRKIQPRMTAGGPTSITWSRDASRCPFGT